jgi:hypothetical protein
VSALVGEDLRRLVVPKAALRLEGSTSGERQLMATSEAMSEQLWH